MLCPEPALLANPDPKEVPFGLACPLCKSETYFRVSVTRPNGSLYQTEFFACEKFATTFLNPGRFTRLGIVIKRWAADVEPKTLAEVHGLVVREDGPTK